MKPCIEYEALYRGSWRSERTAIEKNVLEVAQAELASTASERCRCDPLKPEFNPFRFQPAPPLPRPHLHKMLLNGIGVNAPSPDKPYRNPMPGPRRPIANGQSQVRNLIRERIAT